MTRAVADRPAAELFEFDNSYAALPARLFVKQSPIPVREPRLIALNRDLAEELRLDPERLAQPEGVETFAGNRIPAGAEPLAMAYAGHQFGSWVPQLGDGRALLLGEVQDAFGVRRDIQLKGSGPTPFSRRGDGRAWLGPVLREYLVSEAMHALDVPTTRALAAVTTGEPVYRETALPGAVLTRVAKSHVRVGTFQYFYARRDGEALKTLLEHVVDRLYPEARDSRNAALTVLKNVVRGQAALIAKWMGAGFIHGVMNTDNMSVACETIDFGPCAFMDEFAASKVFSSIDIGGRYAFARQPDIAIWNLAQFATALLPLIDTDAESAVKQATDTINRFEEHFQSNWSSVMGQKLGLRARRDSDSALIGDFLSLLERQQVDFTHAFRRLAGCLGKRVGENRFLELFTVTSEAESWLLKWRFRHADEAHSEASSAAFMDTVNPAVIPRNHQIEKAISDAVDGDYSPFHRLCAALAQPFADRKEFKDLQAAPRPEERVTKTYCGT